MAGMRKSQYPFHHGEYIFTVLSNIFFTLTIQLASLHNSGAYNLPDFLKNVHQCNGVCFKNEGEHCLHSVRHKYTNALEIYNKLRIQQ
jgi:hypothetical protein